jgi:hypothetical protein
VGGAGVGVVGAVAAAAAVTKPRLTRA